MSEQDDFFKIMDLDDIRCVSRLTELDKSKQPTKPIDYKLEKMGIVTIDLVTTTTKLKSSIRKIMGKTLDDFLK